MDTARLTERESGPDAAGALAESLAAALRDSAARMRAVAGAEAEERAHASYADVCVVLPCHDEARTIAAVVRDFRAALPGARVIVFDNRSTDGTAEAARAAGAEVRYEPRKGKGHVVRRMFADVEADVYVMADGDGTYDASGAPKLVAAIREAGADMAVGARAGVREDAHRAGHALGNAAFNRLYGALFGEGGGDVFSGYRAFSRRFVKSFPALSNGFEIETELCVHAGQLKLPVVEIELPYGARAAGTASKLRTFRDGWRILRAFGYLLKETRPALFFGAPATALFAASVALAAPLFVTYARTGLVPRLPTAVLCTGLALIAALLAASGTILDSLARSRAEQKRMLYLAIDAGRGGR